MQSEQAQADTLYIQRLNDNHRAEVRVICVAILFALLVFALWDIHFLGTNSPIIYPSLFTRFIICLPLFITIFLLSYCNPVPRLDIWLTLGFLSVCTTTVIIHFYYQSIFITLPIDSILLCVIVIYFIPNIFAYQKAFLGIVMMVMYFIFLILKDPKLYELIRAAVYLGLLNLAGIIHSISFDRQRRAIYNKNQFLKEMARTDQLTGAENRHRFDDRFNDLLEQARLENQGIAVAIVDIDFFKQYNDHYGHFAGDECLIKVAQTLLHLKRHPLDSCIRFGGEEFILIKYGVNFEQSVGWGQKIIATIHQLNIPHEESELDQRLTVSAGLIHWQPNSALTRTQLMKLADDALYKAKRNGRNQVHVHMSKV
ncbi:MAG: GGDEF domain-containing protein [Gammaproteobacteria bacterium]|nr:GGDEF domain-containing protein [Gammaproteobacteria bacterium]